MAAEFYHQQGQLVNHWYPLATERQLGKEPLRRIALGQPILLLRDTQGNPRAFLDRCPHRSAQLSKGDCDGQSITCPYHGWKFDIEGRCVNIPSKGQGQPDLQLQPIPLSRHLGLIWGWLGEGQSPAPPAFEEAEDTTWRFVQLHQHFDARVEDLIENFMDSPHTVFVHRGLIRGMNHAAPREIHIHSTLTDVTITHPPQNERLGFFDRLINPSLEPISHTDRFTLPASVEVRYSFGESGGRFLGLLAMTPISETKTNVFVVLGLRFGWLNPFLSLLIRPLARRVLRQDVRILSQQAENLALDPAPPQWSIDSDFPDRCVRKLRAWIADPSNPKPKKINKKITIYL